MAVWGYNTSDTGHINLLLRQLFASKRVAHSAKLAWQNVKIGDDLSKDERSLFDCGVFNILYSFYNPIYDEGILFPWRWSGLSLLKREKETQQALQALFCFFVDHHDVFCCVSFVLQIVSNSSDSFGANCRLHASLFYTIGLKTFISFIIFVSVVSGSSETTFFTVRF